MSNSQEKKQKKLANPEDRQTGKDKPYAYSITDASFGEIKVLNSANAWWLEKPKVYNLISVFKIDGTIEEACSYAGITKRQYEYFIEQHPEFCGIIDVCRQLPNLKARQTVVSKVTESYQNAMDYLKRKRKAEFGDSSTVELTQEKPLLFNLKIDGLRNNDSNKEDSGTPKEN